MKNKNVYGCVVAGQMIVAAFVMQGCETVKRPSIGGGTPVNKPRTSQTITVTPGGTAVEPTPIYQPVPVEKVGKPDTYQKFVVPTDYKPLTENGITATSKPHQPLPPPTIIPVKPIAETATVSGDTIVYKVKSGDTFSSIANANGFTTAELASLNGITDPNKIRVGQTIKIPKGRKPLASGAAASSAMPANGKIHVVASGEALSTIAQKYNVKTAELQKANSITDPNKIRVGQKLTIPGTTGTTPTQPPRVVTENTTRTTGKPTPATTTTTTRPSVRPDPTNVVTPEPDQDLVNSIIAPTTSAAAMSMEEAKARAQAVKDAATKKAEDAAAAAAAAAATVTNTVGDKKVVTHTVQEGDDVYSIALKYHARPGEIRKLNEISGNAVLQPGQTLKIPLTE